MKTDIFGQHLLSFMISSSVVLCTTLCNSFVCQSPKQPDHILYHPVKCSLQQFILEKLAEISHNLCFKGFIFEILTAAQLQHCLQRMLLQRYLSDAVTQRRINYFNCKSANYILNLVPNPLLYIKAFFLLWIKWCAQSHIKSHFVFIL